MNKKSLTILIFLMAIVASLSSCKSLIGTTTRNWKKEIINAETTDYRLFACLNLSSGCQHTLKIISKDSIIFTNTDLEDVLMTLSDKTINTCTFVNLTGIRKDFKLDIKYYPAKNTDISQLKTHKDTILYQLGKKLKYSFELDTSELNTYTVTINDKEKLNNFVSPYSGKVRFNKRFVCFEGDNLNNILKNISCYVEGLIIDTSIEDPLNYRINLKSREKEKVMKLLMQDYGLQFEQKYVKLETAVFKFQKF
ncbi:hypothetical protein ACE01N_07740 [Saccharicrinis sp. FJH2]|uniref:hypothetical protein n=1 Tax=Saccharicrinis sp. FJH65 TaxID=3344659 RepID=UPI0035F32050